LAIVVAFVLAVAPIRASWIEFWYSTVTYPPIQRTLTPISNLVPFAILDLLLLLLIPTVAIRMVVAVRQAWRTRDARPVGRTGLRFVAMAAALYSACLALWGLTSRRVRMADRLMLDRAAPTSEQVLELGLTAASEMNSLYAAAHEQVVSGAE